MTGQNRTLDQLRAEDSLAKIRELERASREQDQDYGHYVSYVSALPATIVMNGLGQALATLLATAGRKKEKRFEDPHYQLYVHVASWLSQQMKELVGPPEELIDRIMKTDQRVYLRAQAEAMAYLNWLKRFARAYLMEREDQGE